MENLVTRTLLTWAAEAGRKISLMVSCHCHTIKNKRSRPFNKLINPIAWDLIIITQRARCSYLIPVETSWQKSLLKSLFKDGLVQITSRV